MEYTCTYVRRKNIMKQTQHPTIQANQSQTSSEEHTRKPRIMPQLHDVVHRVHICNKRTQHNTTSVAHIVRGKKDGKARTGKKARTTHPTRHQARYAPSSAPCVHRRRFPPPRRTGPSTSPPRPRCGHGRECQYGERGACDGSVNNHSSCA